ncbi:MAG: hypothetical protein K6B13_09855 [Prevotella sp.]|nr:hypothetical protein [Prevotella sp.]
MHHNCHGHLTTMASWAHDCVLCQFLTLTLLPAAVLAVRIDINVCKKFHPQPLCGYQAACWGCNITRGPPSV